MTPFNLHILGCGSALPTMRHNPSSQVVELRGKHFLIDCGEGCQLQLRRSRVGFSRINDVFISHIHGDHCFGLIGLICTMGMLGRTAPLRIYAPGELEPMLRAQIQLFCADLGYEVQFRALDCTRPETIYSDHSLTVTSVPLKHRVPCCGFVFREQPTLPHIRRDMIDAFDIPLSQIANIKQGADWTTPDGLTIAHHRLVTPADPPRAYAYCSDTAYMPALAEALHGVDTLYHEATYPSADIAKAQRYAHSTAQQAAEIARQANVGKLIIGHFSARATDEQLLLNEAREVFPNTVLARELETYDVGNNA